MSSQNQVMGEMKHYTACLPWTPTKADIHHYTVRHSCSVIVFGVFSYGCCFSSEIPVVGRDGLIFVVLPRFLYLLPVNEEAIDCAD